MAWLRSHTASDGSTTTNMCWRRDGTQTSETFADEGAAKVFRSVLENQAEEAAYEWLRAQVSDDEPAAVPTLDEAMDSYIDHLTAADEQTKAEYKRMYRRHWSNAICKATGERPLGTLPYDTIVHNMAAEIVNDDLSMRLKLKPLKNTKSLMSQAFNHWLNDPNSPVTHNRFKNLKFLTRAEFELIYREIPDHWKPLVGTLVGSGARWSDATAIPVGKVRTPADGGAPEGSASCGPGRRSPVAGGSASRRRNAPPAESS